MSKPSKGKSAKITYDQAMAALPEAERAVKPSAEYDQAYEQCAEEVRRLHGLMAQERARSIVARQRLQELRDVVSKGDGEGKQAIVYKHVPNPMITQGLLEAVASGEVETKYDTSHVAAINEALLVGGLARVKSRSEAQTLAAARYSGLFDRSQISGARALDYAQPRVDTSGPKQDTISAAQDDAREEFSGARKAMGKRATGIVDTVVICGDSVRTLARKLGYSETGSGRRKAEKDLLAALNILVDYFDLLPREGRKQRKWNDGSTAAVERDEDGKIVHGR